MKWPILLVFATAIAGAESLYVTVPGEGWTLKLDAPALTIARGILDGRRYKYMATSLETGITISLHSETDGASTNEECRDTYWKKNLASPTLKSDINLSSSESSLLVTHLSDAVWQGQTHKTANGHAYFVKNGLCMDLHVSHWPYRSGSEKRVESILRSLAIVP